MKKDALEKLLKDYGFQAPLPEGLSRKIKKSRKKSFINIMKERGRYSLLLLPVSSIFFWIRRLGIAITLKKSLLLLITASLITLGILSIGAYYAVKGKIISENSDIKGADEIKPEAEKKAVIEKNTAKQNEERRDHKKLPFAKIKLINGRVLYGKIISKDRDSIMVMSEDGNISSIKLDMVFRIEVLYKK